MKTNSTNYRFTDTYEYTDKFKLNPFVYLYLSANPNLLWPPNHKTADVTIGGEAKDSLSGILLSTFKVDDEYKTIEPPISDFNTIVKLEAWRDGNDKDGRYYNVSVTTKDKAGNTASNVTTVICPHDRGKK